MDSRIIIGGLGSILDVMETLHEQLLLNQVLESSAEALLLSGSIAPLVEQATLSADEDPFAVSSLKDEHELGSAVLPKRDILTKSLQSTLGCLHILVMLLLLEHDIVL